MDKTCETPNKFIVTLKEVQITRHKAFQRLVRLNLTGLDFLDDQNRHQVPDQESCQVLVDNVVLVH